MAVEIATRPSDSPALREEFAAPEFDKAWEVVFWIEDNCTHTKAEWIGRPFVLLEWELRLIMGLFTTGPDGRRLIRWALIGVAKKNGKTELVAAIALYFLIGDGEPAPLVIVAAASEEQGDLVFGAAGTMCKMSPTLSQITEVYGGIIVVPGSPGAELKRVAAAVGTNDGQNIHAVVCDELHEWVGSKGRNVWTVLTNGTGSRRQPMVLQITTAGFDQETVCGHQYQYGKRVAAGEIQDPHYLFHWIEAPAGADHHDPAVWKAANPSWGVTIPHPEEFFRDQLNKKTEAEFRRYFLNQWTEAEEIWEVAALWDGLQSPLQLDPALPLIVGIDVGRRHDTTAVLCAQNIEDRILLRARVWENPHAFGTRQHSEWELPRGELRAHLVQLFKDFPTAARDRVHGPAFFYDPFMFYEMADELKGERLNMMEYPQSAERMVAASEGFFSLAKQGVIAHDGDPVLRRHIRNVTAEQMPRGWRITKPKGSRKPIDAAVAAAIAGFEASRTPAKAPVPAIY